MRVRVGAPSLGVTFDLSSHRPLALQRPPGGHSLAGGEAVSVWKVVDCVEVDLLHPHRKWAVVECHCVLYYWHCGLLVVSRNFLKNGPPWGTGWCCCGRVLAQSIECTLLATPWMSSYLLPPWMYFMWFTRSFVLISLVLQWASNFLVTVSCIVSWFTSKVMHIIKPHMQRAIFQANVFQVVNV